MNGMLLKYFKKDTPYILNALITQITLNKLMKCV